MKKLTIFFLLFCLYFVTFGAYLENVPTQLVQPNGEVLNLFITGDEFYRNVHDSEGYSIVPGDDGWYYYAMYDAALDELVPSTYRVTMSRNFALPMEKRLGISQEKYMEKRRAFYEPTGCSPSGASKNSILKDLADAKTTQQMNNIVICIGFSNTTSMTNGFSYVDGMFNSNPNNNMRDFFSAMSYGKLDLQSHFYPPADGNVLRFYQDPNPRNYYQPYSSSNTIGYQGENQRIEREQTLLINAVNWVNEYWPVPNELNLDINDDGNCDFISFVVYGNVGGWNDLLWPHKWSLFYGTVFINGKKIEEYNFELDGSTTYFSNNVFCHEGFHVLSAPDLYHYYNYTSLKAVNTWDLMDYNYLTKPQSMCAYLKYRYGHWVPAPIATTINKTYEIFPFYFNDGSDPEKPILYRIPLTGTSSQFSTVEYRKRAGTNYDIYLPNEGFLIYRINANFEGNAGFDGTTEFDEVYLYRPGSSQTNGVYSQGNLDEAPYNPYNGKTVFNSTTNPKPCQSNGTAETTQNINNILYDSETDSYTFYYGDPENRNFSVNKTELLLEMASGATGTLTITSNVLWRIAIPENASSWLSVSKTKGLNTETVTFTALTENTNEEPRVALVTLTGNGQTLYVNVIQNSQNSDYIVIGVSANPQEGGTVSGGGIYHLEDPVTITASPNSGYEFINWTVGDELFSTDANYSFPATAHISLVANFSLLPPSTFFEDNFDEYVAGQPLIGQGIEPWRTWTQPTPSSENPMVVNAKKVTKPNSILIQNNNDLIFPFDNLTTGRYSIEFDFFIPSGGNGAYFNVQHINPPGAEWAFEVYFYNNGKGYIEVGDQTKNFNCKADQWFHIFMEIDLDIDQVFMDIDGKSVYTGPFHYQSDNINGTNQLGGVNFFAGSATPDPSNPDETLPGTYYIDNFKVMLFPILTTVSVTANPSAYGTASGAGTYNLGDNVTVFAIAKDQYHFVNWTKNNEIISTDAAYFFTLNNPVSLVAVFKAGQGVDDLDQIGDFKVYPNPATNELTITNYELGPELNSGTNIEIFDVYGKKISQISNLKSQVLEHINISQLPSGVYFIKIIHSKGFSVQKFIKN